MKGKVYLVGAGPGRADLITVRGAEVLRAADCVIYDKLANPALLKFTGNATESIYTPKRVDSGACAQEEITRLMIEKASSGQTVVRLKGGDPCVFGRCAEEAVALGEAGIEFEIVPGVTAGIAAAAFTGIMLTNRDYSSQLVFVTGHEAQGKQQSNIDWRWLAKFEGTIVFYMAMGNLELITGELIKNGMKEDTPAAVIADVSWPSQRVTKTSLQRIDEQCKQENIGPPAIVVIGAAAADSGQGLNWFMRKPLFGKNIVVTRDRCGNADFADKIIERGGNPIQFETIKIRPLTQSSEFLRILAKIVEFDWVVFTSANGVTIFFDCLQGLGKDVRVFGSAKIAVIGTQTAAKLSRFGIKADFVPSVFTSKELGKQLIDAANLQGKKVLLLRSELALDELGKSLEQAGAEVVNVSVYTIEAVKNESGWLTEKITDGMVDWLSFASPSSARGFFGQIDGELVNSSNVKVASVGPVTSEQLKKLGVRVDVTATEHTLDGLLGTIEEQYK